MNEPSASIYEFSEFRLETAKRLLLRAGKPLALTAKAFEVLQLLVREHGRVVTKDELLETVWRDTIVEENNLSVNISTLRKILGEGPHEHRFIVTVPGVGYKFVADVREVLTAEPTASEDTGPATPPLLEVPDREGVFAPGPLPLSAPHPQRPRLKVIGIYTLLGTLLGVVAFWQIIPRNRKPGPADSMATWRIKPRLVSWENEAGEADTGARFSPDGTMIAYSLTKDGQSNIWTKQVAEGRPNQVTEGAGRCSNPIWSPDGQRLAFIANRDKQTAIWTTPFSGGTLTPVKTLDDGRIKLKQWSKNGATIYYQLGFNLFALNLTSKQTTQLTNFDSTNQAQFLSLSPNEDRLTYSAGPNEHLRLFVMPVGGQPLQVTNDDEASDEYPFWLPDGNRLLYSSKRDGIFQTWLAYIDGRKASPVNLGFSDTLIRDVSNDGSKILFVQSKEVCDLWQAQIEGAKETQLTGDDANLELWPDIAPDGQSVVFQAATEGKHLLESTILVRSLKDNQETKLVVKGFSPSISPESGKVAFLRDADNRINLWLADKNGGGERQLTTTGVSFSGFSQVPYNRLQQDFSWSPDGNSLAYCARNSGLWNVWRVSANGNEPQQITRNADTEVKFSGPLWAHDGQRVAYLSTAVKASSDAKTTVNVCWLNGANCEAVFSSGSVFKLLGWDKSGNFVIAEMAENKPASQPAKVSLLLVSVGNNRTELASLEAAYFDNIRLSPDGLRIAYANRAEGKDSIRVVSLAGGENAKLAVNQDANIYISGIAWSPDGKAIYYSKQKQESWISMIEGFK